MSNQEPIIVASEVAKNGMKIDAVVTLVQQARQIHPRLFQRLES